MFRQNPNPIQLTGLAPKDGQCLSSIMTSSVSQGLSGDEICVVILYVDYIEMTTFSDHHQAYHNNWSCSDLPSDCEDPQDISISKILSHSSISFGRFAAESLAWEKRSVFSHNRCQEELEKFKAPGIVAQKKAYFEEYYRRIRALKVAEAEAQKQKTTHHPEPYQDELTASTSAEVSVDDTESKEKEQTNSFIQTHFSGSKTTCPNFSGDIIENKSQAAVQQSYSAYLCNNKSSVENETDFSISVLDLGHSPGLAFPEPVPYSDSSSEVERQNSLVSDKGAVNLGSCQQEVVTPVLKPKVTIALARNRTKPDCKTTNNDLKPSEKLNPFSQKKVAGIVDKKLQASRETTSKPVGNARSNSASSHGSPTKVPNRATVLRSSTASKPQLPPASSSAQTKISLNTKVLPEKLKSRLPVNTLSCSSARITQKEITTKGSMGKVAADNRSMKFGVARKSSDLTRCNMIPKGGQPMTQRPTAMSTTPNGQNKSNRNSRTESLHRSYYRGHLKEITTLQSAEPKRNQSECSQPRPKTRGWL